MIRQDIADPIDSAVSGNTPSLPSSSPPRLRSSKYRYFEMINGMYIIAFTVHVLFFIFFGFLGKTFLQVYNITSCIIFAFCLFLNLRGYLKTAAAISTAEIILHAVLCVLAFGWGGGFQFYILCIALVAFLGPWDTMGTKVGLVLVELALFIALRYISQGMDPYSPLDPFALNLFSFFNTFGVFLAIGAMTFLYSSATLRAETDLEKEHQKSEALLHNILPVTIADRLKMEPGTIADGFDHITVLFSDLVGFTGFSKEISPDRLVGLLNRIFSRFDNLTDKYAVEKIKTIGDAYMVVGGLPVHRRDHAEIIADLSLDMMRELEKFNKERAQTFTMRVGIHTGPAVAGVIGKKKFAYDVWGDTVNTASRMESLGLPGYIQVSEETYLLLNDKYILEERGVMDVKGRGQMKTYFLQGKRAEAKKTVKRIS